MHINQSPHVLFSSLGRLRHSAVSSMILSLSTTPQAVQTTSPAAKSVTTSKEKHSWHRLCTKAASLDIRLVGGPRSFLWWTATRLTLASSEADQSVISAKRREACAPRSSEIRIHHACSQLRPCAWSCECATSSCCCCADRGVCHKRHSHLRVSFALPVVAVIPISANVTVAALLYP